MPLLKLKTIGVIARPQKPEALAVVCGLRDWCKARAIEMRALGEAAEQADCMSLTGASGELSEGVDLIVVLGGDGTMLGASRLVGARQIPVLGVNFGWLGYLTEFTLDELYPTLDKVLAGDFSLERRMQLEVTVNGGAQVLASHRALNEAVVNEAAPARMIEFECLIDGMPVNTFRADGMIVATPTGSTAYSLSAGGPIVHPAMEAILLTPVCPHTLSNRPVVVPGECEVEIRFKKASDALMLTIDGQLNIKLSPDDHITLGRSRTTFDIVRPVKRNYFDVLRTKLKWGGR